jgi:hypothetical protein
MRPNTTPETFIPELRAVPSAKIARIIRDARRMRAEARVELFRSAGRSIARLGRALATLVATPRTAHSGMRNA